MKTINFTNNPDFETLEAAGIILTCDENMDYTISDKDYKRMAEEFPAAYMDSFEVLKPSKKMEATIEKLEKEYGKLNRDYFVEPIEANRVGRGFYDGCTLTCDIIKSLNIVVAHDGTWYKL